MVTLSALAKVPIFLDAIISAHFFKGSKQVFVRPTGPSYRFLNGTWRNMYGNAYAAIETVMGRNYEGSIHFRLLKSKPISF
jgi:hypothetical protein